MSPVLFLAVSALFAVAVAAPAEPVAIVRQDMNVEPDGKFSYSFETADGTSAQQDGELKVIDKDNSGVIMKGQFAYKGDDGQTYSVTYIADENGYQPQGAHLPVPPEVPAPIARALAYLATAPPPKE